MTTTLASTTITERRVRRARGRQRPPGQRDRPYVDHGRGTTTSAWRTARRSRSSTRQVQSPSPRSSRSGRCGTTASPQTEPTATAGWVATNLVRSTGASFRVHVVARSAGSHPGARPDRLAVRGPCSRRSLSIPTLSGSVGVSTLEDVAGGILEGPALRRAVEFARDVGTPLGCDRWTCAEGQLPPPATDGADN